MSSPTDKYQQYIVPEEFQERLTDIGGVNRYDEPNFIMIWSQGGGEHATYRSGGAWDVEGLPSVYGYRDLLVGGGVPCWALLQWQDALHYGTPEMYYVQNLDESTQLQDLGEYPYSGRYRLLYNLRWTEKRDNELIFEMMPLNSYLLDEVVPIILEAKEISHEKTLAAMKDIKEREDAADIAMIEDVMRSSALPFGGSPVSYGKQGCRTPQVDKKIESMQKNWNKMMVRASDLGGAKGRGLIQR